MEKGVDELKKPSSSSSISEHKHHSVAQLFLKIISANIAVTDEEASFIKQIQDSELCVQVKHASTNFKTKHVMGSLIPQWHAGFTFALSDLHSPIKLKLVSTKRHINTKFGKASIIPHATDGLPSVVEIALEMSSKKLKSATLNCVIMLVNLDTQCLARNYSVITNRDVELRPSKYRFCHVNSPYHTNKGIKDRHPSFKVVLERASYFAGEILRGAVIFDLKETTDRIKYIIITATGTETSIWTEGSGSSEVTYTDSITHFSVEKYILCAPTKEGITLLAGSHVYPFELQLPTLASSSIGCYGAKMTYLIDATVKSKKKLKHSQAFFNVYGPESKFQPPLVMNKPPGWVKKHLKDNWTGEVIVSSPKQYPNGEYGLHINYHNVKLRPVKQIKVSIKLLIKLRIQSKFERENHRALPLLEETIPIKKTTAEHVEHDFRYVLPVVPPTITGVDGIELFHFQVIVKVSVMFTNLKKKYRVIPITVGIIIPEDVAKMKRDVNPDCAIATLSIYEAKEPKVHGLVAYKSNSIQFFDENIFRSYSQADLVRIENVAVDQVNNNNNMFVGTTNSVPNNYVDIDNDEIPDKDESM